MSVTTDNKMKAKGIEKIAFGLHAGQSDVSCDSGIFMVVLVQDMGFPAGCGP